MKSFEMRVFFSQNKQLQKCVQKIYKFIGIPG